MLAYGAVLWGLIAPPPLSAVEEAPVDNILELQPFRQSDRLPIVADDGSRGEATLENLNTNINSFISALGTNDLWVFRFEPFGKRPTTEELNRKQLTYEDGIAMRSLPHVLAVDPALTYQNFQLGIGNVSLKAVEPKRCGITGTTGVSVKRGMKKGSLLISSSTTSYSLCLMCLRVKRGSVKFASYQCPRLSTRIPSIDSSGPPPLKPALICVA